MRAPTSELLTDNMNRNKSRMRKQTRAHFRLDLDALPDDERNALTNTLTALLTFEAIETMRFDQGLSKRATHQALVAGVRRILHPGAA